MVGGTAQPSSRLNREPAAKQISPGSHGSPGSESRTFLPAAQVSFKFSCVRKLARDLSVGDRAVFGG